MFSLDEDMSIFGVKCQSVARLDEKTAIVTGCNTGIGKETVMDFYKRGARVIMACRSLNKAEAAKKDIMIRSKGLRNLGEIVIVKLDLSSLTSVRKCANHILETESKINILVNNAGVMITPEGKTEDGFDIQFGTNHLAHFLFTLLLFPRICNSKPARIVNVSSRGHIGGRIHFDDLHFEKRPYNPIAAYRQSKLANILFTKQLAKIIEKHGITGVNVYCLHPGVIATDLARHADKVYFSGIEWIFKWIVAWFIKTPEEGAQTTIYCAVDEKCANENGLYYSDCEVSTISNTARNEEVAEKLWKISEKLVDCEYWNPVATDKGIPS